jgi:hypothetical protein
MYVLALGDKTIDPKGVITVWKWRSDVQKEYAERADWMLEK